MRKYIDHIISIPCDGILLKIFCCILLLHATRLSHAQDRPSPEYQLKAVFIFNFTKFVEWPPLAYESYNEPFVITVLGNDPFGNYLDQAVSGEKMGMHPIQVKRITDTRQLDKCQILFINERDPAKIRAILAEVNDRNILTVSDASNFARLGGMIGFYTENNKIRMQINTNAAKNAQLNISSKLLRVAKVL